jgi:hypothetical protein
MFTSDAVQQIIADRRRRLLADAVNASVLHPAMDGLPSTRRIQRRRSLSRSVGVLHRS